jgi:hypothetical protein
MESAAVNRVLVPKETKKIGQRYLMKEPPAAGHRKVYPLDFNCSTPDSPGTDISGRMGDSSHDS